MSTLQSQDSTTIGGGASPPTDCLEASLGFLKRGWSVVPQCCPIPGGPGCQQHGLDCSHPGKRPLVSWTAYQDRLPTEGELRAWWAKWPGANVGIVLGNISRLMVLDVDARSGGNDTLDRLVGEAKKLPDGPLVMTGGGGRHFYFAIKGPIRSIPDLLPGIELKADGATVTAPPSLHRLGERYQWVVAPDDTTTWEVPDWLRQEIDSHRAARRPLVLPPVVPAGERNATLFRLAAAMRAMGMSQAGLLAALQAENARCAPPLPDKELEGIAQSATRYGPATRPQRPSGVRWRRGHPVLPDLEVGP